MMIYRLENRHNSYYGIYNVIGCSHIEYVTNSVLGDEYNSRTYHPSPSDDEEFGDRWYRSRTYSQYCFGFDSYDQLNRWFPMNVRLALSNSTRNAKNVHIGIYNYDGRKGLFRSKKQVAFKMDKAIRIDTKPFLWDGVATKNQAQGDEPIRRVDLLR